MPKYVINREDGTPVDGEFVMLRVDTDYTARTHAVRYAVAIAEAQPEISAGIIEVCKRLAHPAEVATWWD